MRIPNSRCSLCNKPIYRRPSDIAKYPQRFCEGCQAVLYSNSAKKGAEARYVKYIGRWKAGKESGMRGKTATSQHIIRYIKEKHENKCARCDWGETNPYTGNVPVEIEHIDGDFTNNKEGNLALLCPSCHSLTKTYKGANRGKGRPR